MSIIPSEESKEPCKDRLTKMYAMNRKFRRALNRIYVYTKDEKIKQIIDEALESKEEQC